MNNFFTSKIPTKMFFHYKAMFKAAFRFLTDTRLSVSTLLAANFRHKKSVNPLDILSITDFGYLSRMFIN